MPLTAADAIAPAFQHAKRQLLQPFRFGQWARLALVGLLAGEMGSAGGCNFHFNAPWPHHTQKSEQFLGAVWPSHLANHPAQLVGLILILTVVGMGFALLMIYVNSMMRFILFDSIVAKECHIRQGWAHRKQQGLRYFVWQIVFMLVSIAAFLILIGVPVAFAWMLGLFTHPSEHLLPLILGGILLFLLFVVLVVVLAVVQVMTKDFVVPQMALEDLSAVEGWGRLWLWLKGEKIGYLGYIGMKIVLAIGVGIALGMIGVLVLLMLLIPAGGVGLIAVLAGKAAGLTWDFYTIALAVVVGCVLLAALLFAMALISVPAIVFFPAYSMYFLAARYTPLAMLLQPQPVATGEPGSPPLQPPLPPAPAPLG